jgi:hypothetical protein
MLAFRPGLGEFFRGCSGNFIGAPECFHGLASQGAFPGFSHRFRIGGLWIKRQARKAGCSNDGNGSQQSRSDFLE